jgi:hypothetical protein
VISTTVNLTDQITCIGLDLFSPENPTGDYEAIIFNRVIHDWSDPEAMILLNKAKLTVENKKGDTIIAENMDPSSAATHLMLTLLGGKRRQTKVVREMLHNVGCSNATTNYIFHIQLYMKIRIICFETVRF